MEMNNKNEIKLDMFYASVIIVKLRRLFIRYFSPSFSTSSPVSGETPVPWYDMPLWKLSGVLLLIVVNAVIIQQVIKRLMDCCISYCRKRLCRKTDDTLYGKYILRSLRERRQPSGQKMSETERNDVDGDLPPPCHAKPHGAWNTLDRAKVDGYIQMKVLFASLN